MRRIKAAKLRKILWKVMKDGKRWWEPRYRFNSAPVILNDSWVLNLRSMLPHGQDKK